MLAGTTATRETLIRILSELNMLLLTGVVVVVGDLINTHKVVHWVIFIGRLSR
jgi:hypothetical protein